MIRDIRFVGASIGLFALVLSLSSPLPASSSPPKFPESLVAVGDSMTRGFSVERTSECFFRDCPKFSWVSGVGKRVSSHAHRIDKLNGAKKVKTRNFAKTGAKAAALEGQLNRAVRHNPDYTAILIGANDVCAPSLSEMTSESDFRATVSSALMSFAQKTDGYIFVSSIPNIRQLRDLFITNPEVSKFWDQFKVCPTFLGRTVSDSELSRASERLNSFNLALKESCESVPNGRCKWDNYKLHSLSLSVGDVSAADYFHPSIKGQRKIARATWEASHWMND